MTAMSKKLGKAYGANTGFESTDAQMLTTMGEYLTDLMAYGKISDTDFQVLTDKYEKQLAALKKIIAAKKAGDKTAETQARGELEKSKYTDMEMKDVILQPLKPVYTGFKMEQTTRAAITMYLKTSAFPLVPQVVEGLEIENVLLGLEDAGADALIYVSGVKTGAQGVETIFDKEGNMLSDLKFKNVLSLDRSGYKIQQENPYKGAKEVIREATQGQKMLFENLFGKSKNGTDFDYLRTKFGEVQIKILEKKYNEFLTSVKAVKVKKEIEVEPDVWKEVETIQITDLRKLRKILVEEAMDRGYPLNDLMALGLTDGYTQFELPLGFHMSSFRMEPLVLSLIKNKILKSTLPGNAYIQGSNVGFKGVRGFNELSNSHKSDIVWTPGYNPEDGLNYMLTKDNKVQKAQILVPWTVKDGNGKILRISDYTKKDENGKVVFDSDKVSGDVLDLFGFRIPFQGHSSMAGFEIVGFLPEYMGDLAIVPDEIVTQMGSDFDVDKLRTYKYWTWVTKDGRIVKYASKEHAEDLLIKKEEKRKKAEEEGKTIDEAIKNIDELEAELRESMKGLQNQVIEIYNEVMSTPEAVIKGLTPLDEGKIRIGEIGLELEALKNKNEALPNFITPKAQRDFFFINKDGQTGMGVFSLFNTYLALAQTVDTQFKQVITDPENSKRKLLVPLQIKFKSDDGKEIYEGNKVSDVKLVSRKGTKNDVSSGFQSASMDNGNDQDLHKLNMSGSTFGIALAMISQGFDERYVGTFANQEAVHMWVKAYTTKISKVTEDIIMGRVKASEEAFNEVKEMIKKNGQITEDTDKLYPQDYLDDTFSLKEMKEMIGTAPENKGDNYWNDQLKILEALNVIQTMGEDISAAQNATNTNQPLRHPGKTMLNALELKQKLVDVMDGEGITYLKGTEQIIGELNQQPNGDVFIFNPNGLIGASAMYGEVLATQLFKELYPYESPVFMQATNSIGELGGIASMNIDRKAEIFTDLKQYLNSLVFDQLFPDESLEDLRKRLLYDEVKERKEEEGKTTIVLARNSLARRVKALQQTEWGKRSKLLKRLYPRLSEDIGNTPSRLEYMASGNEKIEEPDLVREFFAWSQTDQKVPYTDGAEATVSLKKLAYDLIKYTYATGGTQSPRNFFRLIPYPVMMDLGYPEAIRSVASNVALLDTFILGQPLTNPFYYKNPTNFTRQYFQHKPYRTTKISSFDKKNQIKGKEYIKLKGTTAGQSIDGEIPTENEKFITTIEGLGNLGPGKFYAHFLSFRNNETNRWELYEKMGEEKEEGTLGYTVYRRISTLGTRQESEYNPNDPIAISLNTENLPEEIVELSGENTIPPPNTFNSGLKLVGDNLGKDPSEDPSITEVTKGIKNQKEQIIEMLEDIRFNSNSDYHKKMATAYKEVIETLPQNIKVTIKINGTKGPISSGVFRSSFNDQGEYTLAEVSFKREDTGWTSELAPENQRYLEETIIIHELTHFLTLAAINQVRKGIASPETKKIVNQLIKLATHTKDALIAASPDTRVLQGEDTTEEVVTLAQLFGKDGVTEADFIRVKEKSINNQTLTWAESTYIYPLVSINHPVNEFTAGISASKGLRTFMLSHKIPKGYEEGKNIWEKLLSLLADLVGSLKKDNPLAETFEDKSLYEAALNQTLNLVGAQKEFYKDAADIVEDSEFVDRVVTPDLYLGTYPEKTIKNIWDNTYQLKINLRSGLHGKARIERYGQAERDGGVGAVGGTGRTGKFYDAIPLTLEELEAYNNILRDTGYQGGEKEFKERMIEFQRAIADRLNKEYGFNDPTIVPEDSDIEVKEEVAQYYEGDITPEENTIFVFGSNPEGRHGAGAAKKAKDKFGAKYGQGEGLQGNAYALPTKDLRVKENKGLKSISPQQITESIKSLYETARANPNKQFKVAYRNTTKASLNGYTGLEMIDMFNAAGPIPSNIIFSKEWFNTGKLNIGPAQQTSEVEKKGTINVYWGQAESEYSTKILSNLAPREFTWKGREYGSVEHAYQSNKSGTFDQATYNKYVGIGGYGKKIRGKGTVAQMKKTDSLGLMKQLVVESFKQNSNSEAAKKLMQYESFTHNTNQLIDQAFLEGLILAQQELESTQPTQQSSGVKGVKVKKTENIKKGDIEEVPAITEEEKQVRYNQNPKEIAQKQKKVYRGVSLESQYKIDKNGDLTIFAQDNFGGKTTGVSLTPYLDTALDYATRSKSGTSKRVADKGKIIEITDEEIIKQLKFEAWDEIVSKKEIKIKKGKYTIKEYKYEKDKDLVQYERVIGDYVKGKLKEYKDMSIESLIAAKFNNEAQGEIIEHRGTWDEGVGRAAPGASQMIVEEFGGQPDLSVGRIIIDALIAKKFKEEFDSDNKKLEEYLKTKGTEYDGKFIPGEYFQNAYIPSGSWIHYTELAPKYKSSEDIEKPISRLNKYLDMTKRAEEWDSVYDPTPKDTLLNKTYTNAEGQRIEERLPKEIEVTDKYGEKITLKTEYVLIAAENKNKFQLNVGNIISALPIYKEPKEKWPTEWEALLTHIDEFYGEGMYTYMRTFSSLGRANKTPVNKQIVDILEWPEVGAVSDAFDYMDAVLAEYLDREREAGETIKNPITLEQWATKELNKNVTYKNLDQGILPFKELKADDPISDAGIDGNMMGDDFLDAAWGKDDMPKKEAPISLGELKKDALYAAVFISKKVHKTLLETFPAKHKNVHMHHSTIQFMPDQDLINSLPYTQEIPLTVIATVEDEKGQALIIENPQSKVKHPHITVSTIEGVGPKYSNELIKKAIKEGTVNKLATPIVVTGKIGIATKKGEVFYAQKPKAKEVPIRNLSLYNIEKGYGLLNRHGGKKLFTLITTANSRAEQIEAENPGVTAKVFPDSNRGYIIVVTDERPEGDYSTDAMPQKQRKKKRELDSATQIIINSLNNQIKNLERSITRASSLENKGEDPVAPLEARIAKIKEQRDDLLREQTSVETLKIAKEQLDWADKVLHKGGNLSELDSVIKIIKSWKGVMNRVTRETQFHGYNFGDIASQLQDLETRWTHGAREIIGKMVNSSAGLDLAMKDIFGPQFDTGAFAAQTRGAFSSQVPIVRIVDKWLQQAIIKASNEFEGHVKDINVAIEKLNIGPGNIKEKFDKLAQKDENGELTGNLLSRINRSYFQKLWEKRNHINSVKGVGPSNAAYKKHMLWQKENIVAIDIGMLIDGKEIYDPRKTDLGIEQAPTTAQQRKEYREQLIEKLVDGNEERREVATEMIDALLTEQKTLFNKFVENRTEIIEDLKVISVDKDGNFDLRAYEAARDKWDVQNSPFIYNELFNSLTSGGKIPSGAVLKYNFASRYVPSVPAAKHWNKEFEEVMKVPELKEFYDFYVNSMEKFWAYLPDNSDIKKNRIPDLVKDLTEKYSDSALRGIISGANNSMVSLLTDSVEAEIEYGTIETATGQAMPSIPLWMTGETLMPNQKSYDLGKILKAFAAMATNYRHKARVEPQVLLANRLLGTIKAATKTQSGKKQKQGTEGDLMQAEKGLVRAKAQLQYTIEALLYGMTKEPGTPVKILGKQKGFMGNEAKQQFEVIKDAVETFQKDLANDIPYTEAYDNYKNSLKPLPKKVKSFIYAELNKEEKFRKTNKKGDPMLDITDENREAYEDALKTFFQRPVTGQSIGNALITYTQALGMGFNWFSATANLVFGTSAVFRHAAGKSEFTPGNARKAFTTMMGSTINGGKYAPTQLGKKVRALMANFDGLAQVVESMYGSEDSRSGNWLYLLQERSEFFVYGQILVAMMHFNKVKNNQGEEKPLWDAFDENGEWNAKEFPLQNNEGWDKFSDTEEGSAAWLKFKMKFDVTARRIHGNYDRKSPILGKKHVLGRMLFQFRSWVPELWFDRWEDQRWDEALERYTKGTWRSYGTALEKSGAMGFATLMAKQFGLQLIGKDASEFENLDEVDKINMRKNMAEIYFVAALAIALFLLGQIEFEDEDEEEQLYMNMGMTLLLNTFTRVNTEVTFFINPDAMLQMTKGNPAPAIGTLSDILVDMPKAIIQQLMGEGQYKAGVRKGHNKLLKETLELIPLGNQYYKFHYMTHTKMAN